MDLNNLKPVNPIKRNNRLKKLGKKASHKNTFDSSMDFAQALLDNSQADYELWMKGVVSYL